MNAQETKDVELLALSAIVFATGSQRAATNQSRLHEGRAIAYDDDVPWPELDALHYAMRARGILED